MRRRSLLTALLALPALLALAAMPAPLRALLGPRWQRRYFPAMVEPLVVASGPNAGTIVMYYRPVGSLGYPMRVYRNYLIPMHGQQIPRTDLPELFTRLRDTYWFSDTDQFLLPDLRGCFQSKDYEIIE